MIGNTSSQRSAAASRSVSRWLGLNPWEWHRGRLVAGAMVLLLGGGVQGATVTWDDGYPGDFWGEGLNWDTDSVPDDTDDVVFGTGLGGGDPIQLSVDRTVNSLTITTTTAFSLEEASLTITNGAITRSAASGTTTINSDVVLGANGAWDIAGTGTLAVNGLISDTSSGFSLTKSGTGTLILTGDNTFSGATTVSGGTLDADGVDALGDTSEVEVGPGGTLLLSGSGDVDRINNSAGIILAGGSLVKGAGASEGSEGVAGLGALTLSTSSTIDFGSGGVGDLVFAGFTPSGYALTIANWTGTALTEGVTGTTDRLIVQGDQSANLSAYEFTGYGSGGYQIDLGGGYYEIVPVPEPGAVLAAVLLMAPVAWRERRSFLRVRQGA